MKQYKILLVVCVFLVIAGCLDFVTTSYGTSVREVWITQEYVFANGDQGCSYGTVMRTNPETRIFYVPFLVTLFFGVVSAVVMFMSRVPFRARIGTVVFLIAVSFTGSVHNLLVLGGIIT